MINMKKNTAAKRSFIAIFAFIAIMLMIPMSYAKECKIPEEITTISEDTIFCEGNYIISTTIEILKDNIMIDCNSATIMCDNVLLNAIKISDRDNITLKSCTIQDCQNGIYIKDSNSINILGSWLENNKIGIAIEDSKYCDFQSNHFNNNKNSLYSIRSVLDSASIISGNEFDIAPVIQDYVPKEEPEEVVNNPDNEKEQPNNNTQEEEEEEEEAIEEVTSTKVEIKEDSMRKILNEVIAKHNPKIDKNAKEEAVDTLMQKYLQESYESLSIERIVTFNGTHTRIKIKINPRKAGLEDISYYENIDKCIARYVAEVIFVEDYEEIIKEDPMIMWHFTNLELEKEINYIVEDKIDKDCLELLSGIGIVGISEEDFVIRKPGQSREEENMSKKEKMQAIFALILIPIIAIAIIYFSRFKNRQQ